MTVDIVICFLTAEIVNMKPVKKLSVIAYHYAIKGNFITDIAATIPGFMIITNPGNETYKKLYWFKLIRFIQIRTVYGAA